MGTVAIETKTVKEKLIALIDGFDETRTLRLYTQLKRKAEREQKAEDKQHTAIWTNEFVAELDRRWEEIENGGKTYSLEEMDAHTEVFLKSLRAAKK